MKKSTIVLIWIAVGLCIAGLIAATVGLFMMNFNFKNVSVDRDEEKTYEVSEDFDKISIDIIEGDIILARSTDGKCRVDCKERERFGYSVSVVDGTLRIETMDGRKWYDHISIGNFDRTMTVYLAAEQYDSIEIDATTGDVRVPEDFSFGTAKVRITTGDVKWQAEASEELSVKTTTGDISISGASPKKLQLKSTTGKIALAKIKCETADIKGGSGDCALAGVVAYENLNVSLTTGDIELRDCDARSLSIEATTGDIEGTLLSGKIFSASTTTGDVRVPSDSEGGSCKIKTTTGDIYIRIAE